MLKNSHCLFRGYKKAQNVLIYIIKAPNHLTSTSFPKRTTKNLKKYKDSYKHLNKIKYSKSTLNNRKEKDKDRLSNKSVLLFNNKKKDKNSTLKNIQKLSTNFFKKQSF